MLSSFALSHEEVVARRLLNSKKTPEEVRCSKFLSIKERIYKNYMLHLRNKDRNTYLEDHRSYVRNSSSGANKAWKKIQACCMGFQTMTSAIPVQHFQFFALLHVIYCRLHLSVDTTRKKGPNLVSNMTYLVTKHLKFHSPSCDFCTRSLDLSSVNRHVLQFV